MYESAKDSQLRFICHPELRRSREWVWGLIGEEDSSQEDEKNKCLVNECLPYHADKSFSQKVIFSISSWYRALSKLF